MPASVAPVPPPSSGRIWAFLPILLLVLAAAYSNTFRVPLIFDDVDSIRDNPSIDALRTAFSPPKNSGSTVSGRPILNASFALSNFGEGDPAIGHRIVNLLIHSANTLLLFALLHSLLEHRVAAPTRRGITPGQVAVLAAGLWALHPLQTSAVTYLVQRAESLAALFYLTSLYTFARGAVHPQKKTLFFALSVLACAIGMGAKETVATAPVAILLLDRYAFAGSFLEAWRRRKGYYFALAFTWSVIVLSIVSSGLRGKTVGINDDISLFAYYQTQIYAFTQYLTLLVFPKQLIFDYGIYNAPWDAGLVIRGISLLIIGGCTLYGLIKNTLPGLLFSLFFLLLTPTTLIPVLTQTIAEHRVYLPSACLLTGAVLLAACILDRRVFWTAFALFLTAAASLTYHRNQTYQTIESLWKDTLAKWPINDRAWFSLGHLYLNQGKNAAAREAFHHAFLRKPGSPDNLMGYGHALAALGDNDRAIAFYEEALRLVPATYRGAYESMTNLGMLLEKKGLLEKAEQWLKKAISISPAETGAYYNLGSLLFAQRRYSEAIPALEHAVGDKRQGTSAQALHVRALLSEKQTKEALACARRYTRTTPTSTELQLALGQALAANGLAAEAIDTYNKLLALDPPDHRAHTHLGALLLAARRIPEALFHLERAIVHSPEDAFARISVADALMKLGRLSDAVAHYREAVRLDPHDHRTRYVLANALLQLGELLDAADHYEKLISARAEPLADIHNELGIVYAQLGELAKARQHFLACLRLSPGHPRASDNIRLLDEP